MGRTTGESRAQRLASRPRSSFWLLSSQLLSVWTPCGPLAETHGETESDGKKPEEGTMCYRALGFYFKSKKRPGRNEFTNNKTTTVQQNPKNCKYLCVNNNF